MTKKQEKTSEQRLADHKKLMWRVLAVAAIALVGVLGTYIWQMETIVFSKRHEEWGQFGDYVGGLLNPFFALCALFALLYTIVLQVEELQQMRKEFTKTMDAAKHQTFEATFFQLLRLHNSNVETMEMTTIEDNPASPTIKRERIVRGRAALHSFVGYATGQILQGPEIEELDPPDDPLRNVRLGFEQFYETFDADLGNYFITIHEILMFIERADIDVDKCTYGRLFRTQLASACPEIRKRLS